MDCSLSVLPVPLNAPGELAFVCSEAEGGGHPQLSPEAGHLLHPFEEVYGFAYRVFRFGEPASRHVPFAFQTLGTVYHSESLANAPVQWFLRKRARQRNFAAGCGNANNVSCRAHFCAGAADE